MTRRRRRLVWAVGGTLGALVLLAAGSLALPIHVWRTGERSPMTFTLAPGAPLTPRPLRVWIDTDAACGHGRRTDPDDCLAILDLARSPRVRIVGLSTVFGNAPLAVTDATARALVDQLRAEGHAVPAVHRGAAEPGDVSRQSPARAALRAALADGPLVIVALGPLTNVAAALRGRPDLQARVTRLVAVMGRRQGHLFHPVEGGEAASYLGHGPIFRDFNFAKDPDAAAALLRLRLPATLVPYEVAREVTVTGADLDALARTGVAGAWVARRSRAWLDYWRRDIRRPGFYPFDRLAATYVIDPSRLACARVTAWIGQDRKMWRGLGPAALLVDDAPAPAGATATAPVLYCPAHRHR